MIDVLEWRPDGPNEHFAKWGDGRAVIIPHAPFIMGRCGRHKVEMPLLVIFSVPRVELFGIWYGCMVGDTYTRCEGHWFWTPGDPRLPTPDCSFRER